jgi:hypothetical protein
MERVSPSERLRRAFLVEACLRAPGVAAGERALRAMVASARAT